MLNKYKPIIKKIFLGISITIGVVIVFKVVHYFIAKDFALDAETGSYLTYRELIDKGATYTIFSFIIGIIVGTYIEFFYRDAKLNEHQLERLANNCTGRGDFKGAINYLNRVIKLDRNSQRTYYNLGYCYSKMEEWEKSICNFSKAIDLNPSDYESFNNRAFVYSMKKDFDSAIRDSEISLKIKPDDNLGVINLSTYYYQRSLSYGKQGRYKKAKEDYMECLKLDPEMYGSEEIVKEISPYLGDEKS